LLPAVLLSAERDRETLVILAGAFGSEAPRESTRVLIRHHGS